MLTARLTRFFLVLLAALLAAPAAASQFIVGVMPSHGARSLAERYEPLRAYLEKNLQLPTLIESAPDFRKFNQRTLRGDFDLTVTPAHFARLAQKDAGFQPLVQYTPDFQAVLVSAKPLGSYRELKNKPFAVIDRLAIISIVAIDFLETHGLQADQDYSLSEHRTNASAAHAVTSGAAAAAVVSSPGLMQLPEAVRGKLVMQHTLRDIPGFVFLARPSLAKAETKRLQALLLAYQNESDSGPFFQQLGYDGLVLADETRMKRADNYLKELRRGVQ